MLSVDKSIYIDNNPNMGFKWSAMAEYGVVYITSEELFERPEFDGLTTGGKIVYANDLGWKWDVDRALWHRVRGH